MFPLFLIVLCIGLGLHYSVLYVYDFIINIKLYSLKPGFHSNARNTRKALHKEKYASKIKSAQEMQQMQDNYASKKQVYASSSHATDASSPCARKRNDRIDSIFHAAHTQALALCAFGNWASLTHCSVRSYIAVLLCCWNTYRQLTEI